MLTWHIHIRGLVQGVGFRPFIYSLAQDYDICGWVSNTRDGVHIEFNATSQTAELLKSSIINNAPRIASIRSIRMSVIKNKFFDNFQILDSNLDGENGVWITPDFAMCQKCESEISDPDNRRHGYAFTTCTHCGPRYSIISQLPYDREYTAMESYSMCSSCKDEYSDPLDRRFFSQTNSCQECGISIKLIQNGRDQKIIAHDNEAYDVISELWDKGAIIAIKGVGGYLLTCDARHAASVQRLRKLKHRPSKPLAVMFSSIEHAEQYAIITDKAKEELRSSQSPIVICPYKDIKSDLANDDITPRLDKLGVMIPYTPLYKLLLDNFQGPIIATSANIHQAPIIYQDQEMISASLSDYVLMNDREIIAPQDDSVVTFSLLSEEKIIVRRSRGYAPNYIEGLTENSNSTIITTGADLKSSFTYKYRDTTYVSQYLGNLGSYDAYISFEKLIGHFRNLILDKPDVILSDLHPSYQSTFLGREISERENIDLHLCQHHLAHFASVIGEHHLIHSSEKILGVIWDGTGYGEDQNIWGGEFFIYDNYHFQRRFHLSYFPNIGNDKMAAEPRISAFSILYSCCQNIEAIANEFSKVEKDIYLRQLQNPSTVKSSSMGRLFDAVASILGIVQIQEYEGQAAILLEQEATSYISKNGILSELSYPIILKDGTLDVEVIIERILQDIDAQNSTAYIAAKFHITLARSIEWVAEYLKVKTIAMSGGVFQNGLLRDIINHLFADRYTLLYNIQLSPNDENISYGQYIYYTIDQYK